MSKLNNIRNFAIIAHIDHGKSTFADRLIEKCGNLHKREMSNQMLDSMDIEKEKGITIKAQTVRLEYKSKINENFIFNFIDTPGHVDFSYEVDRSLFACEGSILIVDTSQGIEAQTLANIHKAIAHNHKIIIVLNKIDLPTSDSDKIKKQIESIIGLDTSNAIKVSAKTGEGISDVLETIVSLLPPPIGKLNAPLKAILIDSWYDKYLGIVILTRIIDGSIYKGLLIKMLSTLKTYTIEKVGIFNPKKKILNKINAGEIGFFISNIKEMLDCSVGDTIVDKINNCHIPLLGFKKSKSVIFCGIYPINKSDYFLLADSIKKLQLNDSSLKFCKDTSQALGFGFRCGFLGMLHLEIIKERLQREYGLNIIITAPNVIYKIYTHCNKIIELYHAENINDINNIKFIKEPLAKVTLMAPEKYLGNLISICIDKRGIQEKLTYMDNKIILVYKIPLNEIMFDFYEKIKASSQGYASYDWELSDYQISDLVKMDILINNLPIAEFSFLIHKSKACARGKVICKNLKKLMHRHLFAIPIQAAINGKIIARETISSFKKDVTSKCYGGDITRKRKLLEKQKKGKKQMKLIGNVTIPQNIFLSILQIKT